MKTNIPKAINMTDGVVGQDGRDLKLPTMSLEMLCPYIKKIEMKAKLNQWLCTGTGIQHQKKRSNWIMKI